MSKQKTVDIMLYFVVVILGAIVALVDCQAEDMTTRSYRHPNRTIRVKSKSFFGNDIVDDDDRARFVGVDLNLRDHNEQRITSNFGLGNMLQRLFSEIGNFAVPIVTVNRNGDKNDVFVRAPFFRFNYNRNRTGLRSQTTPRETDFV